MEIKTLARYVFASLFTATILLTAGSVFAQKDPTACPAPLTVTLNATSPHVLTSDFNAGQLAGPRGWLNDPAINKLFLYTFVWKSESRCCQITRGVLTVKMKANQAGQSKTSSDAGNDAFSVMSGGTALFSRLVYTPWPFPAGKLTTVTWTLTPAALAAINAGHLSIFEEDDTMVQSATLQLWGCCLTIR